MTRNLSRRQFLQLSALGLTAAAGAAALQSNGAVHLPAWASPAPASTGETIIPTLCMLCPSSCGLNVRVSNGRAVKVEGNPLHPTNQGVCCPKGQAALELLYSPERLPGPLLNNRTTGKLKPLSWDEAIALLASKLNELRSAGQAHTVGFIFGETRGHERAVIRRLLAAYGSPNAMELMDPDVQAVRTALFLTQGVNDLPVVDWQQTRYVLALGGSFLESSRHALTALSGLGTLRRSMPNRGKLVVVDSRLSVTASKADEWIPIRPGTLGALALGIAAVIINSGLYEESFVRDYTFGFEDFQDEAGTTHQGFKNFVLREYTLPRVEAITGIPSGTIARLAGEFAETRPAVALPPTGRVTLASGNALSSAMAIHALNALVGSIDAPGGILTQRYPKLADLPSWTQDAVAAQSLKAERIDGAGTPDYPIALSTVPRLAERVLSGQPYPLHVLLLSGANPVFDMPGGREFAEALRRVPFVVTMSPVLDETAAHADLILPVATPFEAWSGAYVEGVGYPGIGLAQPAVQPFRDARSLGDILLGLASKLGGSLSAALPFPDYATLVRRGVQGAGLNWDELARNGAWSQQVYFNAAPGSSVWRKEVIGRDRVAAPKDGRFDLFSRELFSALKSAGVDPQDQDCLPHFDLPVETADTYEFPLLLTAIETMTQARGFAAVLPTLSEVYGLQSNASWSSWVELNPRTAAALGIAEGDEVWVESPRGKLRARARLFEGLWPNAVAMPLGPGHASLLSWGRGTGFTAAGPNPLTLVEPRVEKYSGIWSGIPARVRIYK